MHFRNFALAITLLTVGVQAAPTPGKYSVYQRLCSSELLNVSVGFIGIEKRNDAAPWTAKLDEVEKRSDAAPWTAKLDEVEKRSDAAPWTAKLDEVESEAST